MFRTSKQIGDLDFGRPNIRLRPVVGIATSLDGSCSQLATLNANETAITTMINKNSDSFNHAAFKLEHADFFPSTHGLTSSASKSGNCN